MFFNVKNSRTTSVSGRSVLYRITLFFFLVVAFNYVIYLCRTDLNMESLLSFMIIIMHVEMLYVVRVGILLYTSHNRTHLCVYAFVFFFFFNSMTFLDLYFVLLSLYLLYRRTEKCKSVIFFVYFIGEYNIVRRRRQWYACW